eukprot:TRINITY_DN1038_c0_g1_i2.p1 TRINITY_DN1038_c0_g1~~TRINITY_DN1038_c0_g1_i2.p1  ORF type:complete len:106 (-),score=23.75 TRINITY_DN1038_c0_g1_i2:109-426(-)
MFTRAAIRETREETCADIVNLKLIGYRLLHTDADEKDANPKFPHPDCYFAYFFAEVSQLHTFQCEPQENGAIDRAFWDYETALAQEKIQAHITLYNRAYQMATTK